MSELEPFFREPESCLCPICKRVMRLTRVPALKDLDSSQYFFNCRSCDHTSLEVRAIRPDSVCDIPGETDFKPAPLDPIARCERELAELARAAGATLTRHE